MSKAKHSAFHPIPQEIPTYFLSQKKLGTYG